MTRRRYASNSGRPPTLTTEAREAEKAWGADVVEHLLTGRCGAAPRPDGGLGVFLPSPNADVVHEGLVLRAWTALGPWLLRTWIEEHPGSRPWGWWRFHSPRRTVRPIPDEEWASPTPHYHAGGLVSCRRTPEAFDEEREILEDAGLIDEDENRRLADVLRARGPVRAWSWWNLGPGLAFRPRVRLVASGDPPEVLVVHGDQARRVTQGEFLRSEGLLSAKELAFYFPEDLDA